MTTLLSFPQRFDETPYIMPKIGLSMMTYRTKKQAISKDRKLSLMLSRVETLFITLDIVAEESLDKQRQSLTELTTTSKYHNNYLWLLTILI